MARQKTDPVDRILDAWGAATTEQRQEALRTIKRLEDRGALVAAADPPAKKRGRPAKKEAAVTPDPQ